MKKLALILLTLALHTAIMQGMENNENNNSIGFFGLSEFNENEFINTPLNNDELLNYPISQSTDQNFFLNSNENNNEISELLENFLNSDIEPAQTTLNNSSPSQKTEEPIFKRKRTEGKKEANKKNKKAHVSSTPSINQTSQTNLPPKNNAEPIAYTKTQPGMGNNQTNNFSGFVDSTSFNNHDWNFTSQTSNANQLDDLDEIIELAEKFITFAPVQNPSQSNNLSGANQLSLDLETLLKQWNVWRTKSLRKILLIRKALKVAGNDINQLGIITALFDKAAAYPQHLCNLLTKTPQQEPNGQSLLQCIVNQKSWVQFKVIVGYLVNRIKATQNYATQSTIFCALNKAIEDLFFNDTSSECFTLATKLKESLAEAIKGKENYIKKAKYLFSFLDLQPNQNQGAGPSSQNQQILLSQPQQQPSVNSWGNNGAIITYTKISSTPEPNTQLI